VKLYDRSDECDLCRRGYHPTHHGRAKERRPVLELRVSGLAPKEASALVAELAARGHGGTLETWEVISSSGFKGLVGKDRRHDVPLFKHN